MTRPEMCLLASVKGGSSEMIHRIFNDSIPEIVAHGAGMDRGSSALHATTSKVSEGGMTDEGEQTGNGRRRGLLHFVRIPELPT